MKEKNLVILAILVVLTAAAAGFMILRNNAPEQEAANPCANVAQPETGMQCQDALAQALELHPGNLNSIELGTIQFQKDPQGEPRDVEVWLVDINVDTPIEDEVGTMKRVIVGIEPTSVLDIGPFVYQFFPEAL